MEDKNKIIDKIRIHKDHSNNLNRKNYLIRSQEKRNKRLISPSDYKPKGRKPKPISDDEIRNSIADKLIVKIRGRPKKILSFDVQVLNDII